MERKAVLERVITIVSYLTKTDPKTINENSYFYGDLGVDSLDFLEIVLECEKVFGIDLPDNLSECQTVSKLVDAVFENVGVQQIQKEEKVCD